MSGRKTTIDSAEAESSPGRRETLEGKNPMRNTILAMLCAATAFAAINTCPTLQTSGNVGYPLAGPGNLVYDSSGNTTFAGCQVVNAIFSNWDTYSTNGTYIGSAITSAQSNDPLVTTPTFRLATQRGNFTGVNFLDNNDGVNNWSTTTTDGDLGGTVDFVATTMGDAIYKVSFVFTGVVHGTGARWESLHFLRGRYSRR